MKLQKRMFLADCEKEVFRGCEAEPSVREVPIRNPYPQAFGLRCTSGYQGRSGTTWMPFCSSPPCQKARGRVAELAHTFSQLKNHKPCSQYIPLGYEDSQFWKLVLCFADERVLIPMSLIETENQWTWFWRKPTIWQSLGWLPLIRNQRKGFWQTERSQAPSC